VGLLSQTLAVVFGIRPNRQNKNLGSLYAVIPGWEEVGPRRINIFWYCASTPKDATILTAQPRFTFLLKITLNQYLKLASSMVCLPVDWGLGGTKSTIFVGESPAFKKPFEFPGHQQTVFSQSAPVATLPKRIVMVQRQFVFENLPRKPVVPGCS